MQTQITALTKELIEEKQKVSKKSVMVRQMYQHETKLKAQVKDLEEKLYFAESDPAEKEALVQQLAEEKKKVATKT